MSSLLAKIENTFWRDFFIVTVGSEHELGQCSSKSTLFTLELVLISMYSAESSGGLKQTNNPDHTKSAIAGDKNKQLAPRRRGKRFYTGLRN